MQLLSQKFISDKFEEQYERYIMKFRLRFQLIQKVILIPLIIYYTIEKVIQSSWFTVCLNIILGIIILTSLRYQKKCIKVYEILLLIGILLFNIFYATSQYLSIHPERYQFIDGYFLAILSLTILNMMDSIQKAFTLLFIYLYFMIMIPNPKEPLWSQLTKFIIYIILYYQQSRYQQQLMRMTYMQYCKHLTIENNIKENLEMKYYIVNFIENSRQIILQQENVDKFNEQEDQYNFQAFIRKTIVASQGRKIKKQMDIRKNSSDMNLEQFLFYLFTDKNRLRQLENYENKYQDYQHLLFGFNQDESFIIKVVLCFDTAPCAILLITEQQKKQFVDKLKLQNKATLKLLNYFQDIFNTQIRLSLIIMNGILKKYQQSQQMNKCLNYVVSQLYISYNKYYNISDYFSANTDLKQLSLLKFNLIQLLEILIDKMKYYRNNNKLKTRIIKIHTKLNDLFMKSDIKQIQQLFLNLMIFTSQYSNEISIEIDEDLDQSFLPQPIVNVCFYFKTPKGTRIEVDKFPIINPTTLDEIKKNDKRQMDLYISISLLIIRNLGPFDKITMRNIGKSQYKIQFYLYKQIPLGLSLVPIHSFDPNMYIKRDEDWQLVQSQKKDSIINSFNQELRLDTQRCLSSPLPLLKK
ncbi:unnamed protein product [Paramecium pentaurelia]|uniref:Transmembrane protein n=1 Tax=Paramecium pentaurelia TaxID=43138 RepID=A0A8S1X415_9CILI|nr:unnamed protein product [Paramecium pentaurelia]